MIEESHINDPSAAEERAFRPILTDQLLRYPRFEILDLYKLIYQAAMGSEHAIQEVAFARNWLERELKELSDGPEEPIVDTISPDGCIARVNLRPYMAAGGDPSALLEAFIRTANEYQGTRARLRRYWSYSERMAKERRLPFPPSLLHRFFVRMETKGLPTVHHSETYKDSYRPAYRVIVREFLAP